VLKFFSTPVLSLYLCAFSSATEIITLGDSLTFAYESEFGFQTPDLPGVDSIGDGFDPDEVKNWVEILGQERAEYFDLGDREEIAIPLFFSEIEFFFRQENNWAIPGLTIPQLRSFITGEAGFLELLTENSEFEPFVQLLALTNFTPSDFALADLESQIQNSSGRLVFFIGGNDIDAIYSNIYDGGDPGTFMSDYLADATAILGRVIELNPNLPIVLVNVPHVGITPNVKARRPTDAIGTPRATAFISDLNRQLAQLATDLDIGYADIFTPTLSLLVDENPFSVYGVPFLNEGVLSSAPNVPDFVWLDGELAQNFHPNTCAQALIANEIICAFNHRYQTAIPILTPSEILVDVLGRTPAEVDMDFDNWANSYSLVNATPTDDGDADQIPAALEFALGLNPLFDDSHKLDFQTDENSLQITYPVRLPSSSHVTLLPQSSDSLEPPFSPLTPIPTRDADNLVRAQLPITDDRGFLRLNATIPND